MALSTGMAQWHTESINEIGPPSLEWDKTGNSSFCCILCVCCVGGCAPQRPRQVPMSGSAQGRQEGPEKSLTVAVGSRSRDEGGISGRARPNTETGSSNGGKRIALSSSIWIAKKKTNPKKTRTRDPEQQETKHKAAIPVS